MLKQFTLYSCILLTVLSCNIGAPKKPKNLISKSKMVDILIDAKLIGSATYINKNIMKEHGIEVDTYVFEKHGIDSLQFAMSNNYYAYYVKDYKEIYDKVIDSLEALKLVFKAQELKEKREFEKRERDSLEAIKIKDSLKTQDSLKLKTKKDSLSEIKQKKKALKGKEILISPVSNTKLQSRE